MDEPQQEGGGEVEDDEVESENEAGDNEDGSDDVNDFVESEDEEDSDYVSIWDEEEEEEEYGDDDEEEDEVVQRLFMAANLGVAVQQLEDSRATVMRPGSLTLQVKNRPLLRVGDNNAENENNNANNDIGDDHARTAALFGRFVTLLGAERGAGQATRTLEVEGYRFDQHDSFPQQDVDRLFGNVLRSLPALRKLKFEKCALPGPCLELLVSSSLPSLPPPSHLLTDLELTECELDSEGVAHVASMVRRGANRLRSLAVVPASGGLDPADCQVLCESVPHSRTLRILSVAAKAVLSDTLSGAAGSESPLMKLHVAGAFTDDGVASVAR